MFYRGGPERFECPVCHKRFPNKQLLEVNAERGLYKFQFQNINLSPGTYGDCHMHADGLSMLHLPRKFSVTQNTQGKRSANIHFKLFIFNFKLLSKLHMTAHNLSTEMKPPFDCDYCGIEFDDHETMREHKKLHLNRPSYQCLECDYIGNQSQLIKQHMRKHVSVHCARE